MICSLDHTRQSDKQMGKPIMASDVNMPRNSKNAVQSKHAELWQEAQREKLEAMKLKSVLAKS